MQGAGWPGVDAGAAIPQDHDVAPLPHLDHAAGTLQAVDLMGGDCFPGSGPWFLNRVGESRHPNHGVFLDVPRPSRKRCPPRARCPKYTAQRTSACSPSQWQGKTAKHGSARPNARCLPETVMLVRAANNCKVKPSNCRALVWLRSFTPTTAFDWPTLMAKDRVSKVKHSRPQPVIPLDRPSRLGEHVATTGAPPWTSEVG